MTYLTKSGVYIREDANLGTLVYSPYTGQLFSSLENTSDTKKLISWLDCKKGALIAEEYIRALGPGWKFSVHDAEPLHSKYLSSSNQKIFNKKAEFPLVINWLLTSHCSCQCQYCYSKDIIIKNLKEPSKEDVNRVAGTILSYRPLAVVLTGGDPLCSDNLEIALKCLHKKTGLILDTNGFRLEESQIKLFKKYNVFVRVSFDSQNPKDNNILRPSKNNECSLQAAMNAIDKCLQNEIPLGIQTVVTRKNLGNIIPLSEKLPRLGVQCWRLQLVANHKLAENYDQLEPDKERFINHIVSKIMGVAGKKSMGGMFIDIVHNNIPNSVILVLPDGGFYTEILGIGKVPIDHKNVLEPSIEAFRDGVLHREGHTARYLGV